MPQTILQLTTELAAKLKTSGSKLVTAESCTGGGLAYYLTAIPGSSDWFERGFVTYSNLAKEEQLGVKSQTINKYGAVSKEAATEMAIGALRNSEAAISVAITGIAGPTGGTADKPVGLVWFAIGKIDEEPRVFKRVFSGDRKQIRFKSIRYVVKKLLQKL